MSGPQVLLLVLAGFGAGLSGSVAGLASLVSYPALLAVGLPPVTANVTNTVALVFSTVGSTLGSRPELAGQAARLRRLALTAVAGGVCGSALLLLTPSESFESVVPLLIALGSAAVLLPRLTPADPPVQRHPRLQLPGVFLVAGYGGYFGAAAGVLMLALLLRTTGDTLPRANAGKNVVLGLANGTAAVAFAVAGPVRWLPALPLAAGFLAGGRLGPVVVRRAPARLLRVLIAVAGLGLAVHLARAPHG